MCVFHSLRKVCHLNFDKNNVFWSRLGESNNVNKQQAVNKIDKIKINENVT